MVVHYEAYPCDMDAIMAIAKKHGVKVIEDVSHAQGGYYKGRMLGTFGDVAAMSLMSGKSFAIGEAGIMITNDFEIYRRAIRFGHYERISKVYDKADYAATSTIPFGGQKFRIHQVCSALGLCQLKKYEAEKAEIAKAMNYYWDGLKDVKGLHKVYPKWENSDKAGWYASAGIYDPNVYDGVSNVTFVKALVAEGAQGFGAGCNYPLHLSSVFFDVDIFGHGRPTAAVNAPAGTDVAALTGSLPVAEEINTHVIHEPWFKHFCLAYIDKFIEAVHKVADNYKDLLAVNETTECKGSIAHTKRKG